jgi:hypothetical protein
MKGAQWLVGEMMRMCRDVVMSRLQEIGYDRKPAISVMLIVKSGDRLDVKRSMRIANGGSLRLTWSVSDMGLRFVTKCAVSRASD